MKLANKAFVITLLMLTLVFTATAQNLRSAKDPRNTAPTIGGGGATGGPTGLFTVYDGQTLRKGEYTLSAGISNYDRDPGNVDFTTVPLSFQVGLTDNIELFFGTEAYRGVKVNSRRNLSSNYLPNSQFATGTGFFSAPAIVLSPQGSGVSAFPNSAVFRPQGAPFVQFPFVGGNAGNFGLGFPFFSGPTFGFPAGTNAQLGVAASTGGGADRFPGIGSVYGSILPGIVLQTVCTSGLPTCTAAATAPSVFTTAPTYVADAPFINRSWATSAFNSYDAGVKVRLTNIKSPIGFGFVAYYRWYADNANSTSGFNQLQRGAGPGGNNGDVGVALFADARLAKWVNVAANVEYVYTSSVKGQFPSGKFTLLDRGDEVRSSLGVDFPVNKFFQPILELRSIQYVGGRTPNAFEVNPLDGLAGVRVFARRWFGFSAGYRYNFNQQDRDSFSTDTSSNSVVSIPCRLNQLPNCVSTTITNSVSGVPSGFQTSTDPHGYVGQVFIGRRDKRQDEVVNIPANVTAVTLSDNVVTLGCPPGQVSENACDDSRMVKVSTSAADAENDVLTYNYTVSGGRIVGQGANVDWDLSGVQPGTYTITTGVDDGCGVCGKTETKTITVEECKGCKVKCDCATLTVSGPSAPTKQGDSMTFTANLSSGAGVTYNWTVSAGSITSGQGTASIMVDTTGLAGQNVTATVDISGLEPGCNCPTNASETAGVVTNKIDPILSDEFGPLQDDDVKARVDNFYIQLNNDPNAQGYIINYGTAAEIRRRRAQLMKAINFRKYDVSRVTFVDSVTDGGVNTKFYLVPAGADNPTP